MIIKTATLISVRHLADLLAKFPTHGLNEAEKKRTLMRMKMSIVKLLI